MLRKLIIQNYAIIDEIEIDFSGALTIITGETGAGKSILMGALSLILGERADSSVLVNTTKKCFIEGYFSVDGKQIVLAFLAANHFDIEEVLILRREIAANGKSRAFINDTPATLQQLKALASLLVDLHQQFDTLELSDTDFQRAVLDALANNEKRLTNYQQVYQQYIRTNKELLKWKEQKIAFQKELDYHQFLFNELADIALKENELEELDQELKLLSNAEAIKATLEKTFSALNESEQPIVQQLKQLVYQLQGFIEFHPDLGSVIQRLQSAQIELQDIAEALAHINQTVHYDEQRIEWINQRLMDGFKLIRKHGVQNTNQLLEIQIELARKLRAVLDMDEAIFSREKELVDLQKNTTELAETISKARHQAIIPFEKNVNQLLAQVGMPNARLKVALSNCDIHVTGKDQIDFLFDANMPAGPTSHSSHFEPIRKVASGGELSRLMLCIKSLVAQSINLPTLIFDEIDTGISGEAAKQVGMIMKGLAVNRQIICITHQAQIAGKADVHYYVYKERKADKIKTNIRLLNQEERILTLAQMLSGEKPTLAALETAREMIVGGK